MKNYVSPNGSPIVGTAESVLCTAEINGIEDDGTPAYAGETEVFWDTQEPVTREGKIIFVDENADEWTFDQLVPVDEIENEMKE